MEFEHRPVMLRQAVEALNIRPDGIYVDGTAGGGGHSEEIARHLTDGRLIALDRDPDAIAVCSERLSRYPCVTVVESNYTEVGAVLDSLGIEKIDGMLLDIGVSSHQLDTPERGFSYHTDAPLDMRMSQSGMTAAELVNQLSIKELYEIISRYGEEKYAYTIARAIVREREKEPIETTLQLSEIIKEGMPMKARRDGHPARKTFQAIRIAVNGELDCLSDVIAAAFGRLAAGGRLAIITFHSLEDRIVKRSFASLCEGCTCPPDFPVCVCGKKPKGRLPFKLLRPDETETVENMRARSATLRAIEKL